MLAVVVISSVIVLGFTFWLSRSVSRQVTTEERRPGCSASCIPDTSQVPPIITRILSHLRIRGENIPKIRDLPRWTAGVFRPNERAVVRMTSAFGNLSVWNYLGENENNNF